MCTEVESRREEVQSEQDLRLRGHPRTRPPGRLLSTDSFCCDRPFVIPPRSCCPALWYHNLRGPGRRARAPV